MTILHPGCKINLGLKVLDRRPDGFHNLLSIFLPLPFPRDVLAITPTRGGFSLRCGSSLGPDNTLEKAWRLFAEAAGRAPGCAIALKKGIPMGAGLGGGSSDAAALLRWLNGASQKPLSEAELMEVAAAAGSDAPFFLFNKPAIVSGKGEIIRPAPLPEMPFWLVLVWPVIHSPTAQAFRELDAMRGALTNVCGADKKSPTVSGAAGLPDCANDLEAPVFRRHPLLADLKKRFLELGAARAAMSGSGSAVYGVFTSQERARRAAQALLRKFKHVYFSAFAP